MHHGQYVLYKGEPFQVARILASIRKGSFWWQTGAAREGSQFELIPMTPGDPRPYVYVQDPTAEEIVLAPGCTICDKRRGYSDCHVTGAHDLLERKAG